MADYKMTHEQIMASNDTRTDTQSSVKRARHAEALPARDIDTPGHREVAGEYRRQVNVVATRKVL